MAMLLPPIPDRKPELYIFIDDTVPIELELKKQLTVSWCDRLNKKVMREKDWGICKRMDDRRKLLDFYFNIKIVDRGRPYRPFSYQIGTRYSARLPENEALLAPQLWIEYLEYIRDDYYYDTSMDKYWKLKEPYVCFDAVVGILDFDLCNYGFSPPSWLKEPKKPVSPLKGFGNE